MIRLSIIAPSTPSPLESGDEARGPEARGRQAPRDEFLEPARLLLELPHDPIEVALDGGPVHLEKPRVREAEDREADEPQHQGADLEEGAERVADREPDQEGHAALHEHGGPALGSGVGLLRFRTLDPSRLADLDEAGAARAVGTGQVPLVRRHRSLAAVVLEVAVCPQGNAHEEEEGEAGEDDLLPARQLTAAGIALLRGLLPLRALRFGHGGQDSSAPRERLTL